MAATLGVSRVANHRKVPAMKPKRSTHIKCVSPTPQGGTKPSICSVLTEEALENRFVSILVSMKESIPPKRDLEGFQADQRSCLIQKTLDQLRGSLTHMERQCKFDSQLRIYTIYVVDDEYHFHCGARVFACSCAAFFGRSVALTARAVYHRPVIH